MPKNDGSPLWCERLERLKAKFVEKGQSAILPIGYAVALSAAQADQIETFGSKFKDHKRKTKEILAFACRHDICVLKGTEHRCGRVPATSHGVKLQYKPIG